MAEFARVKDKATGHEYTLAAASVNPDHHEVLKKPATNTDGRPLPAKPHINLPKATTAEGSKPSTSTAAKATEIKETS